MYRQKRTYSSLGSYGGQPHRPISTRRRKLSRGGRYQAMAYRRPAPLALRQRTALNEIKCFDENIAAAAVMSNLAAVAGAEPAAAYTGITEINCIRQDATVAGRIGNKVVIKSIHCKFNMTAADAVTATVRAMLVYDRQPTGAFPAITDILLDQPLGGANGMGGLNIANKSRFSVIRDQYFAIDKAQSLEIPVNWYIKGRWEVEFGANAGSIGDFRTGAIYFICFQAFAAGGNANLTSQNCRCRYFD